MGFLKAVRGTPQEVSLRSDMLRDKALKLILDHATPVDADGNVIEIDLGVDEGGESPAGPAGESEVVEGEVVEGEVVEGEVVMGEVVEGQAAPPDTVEGETVAGADQSENGDDAAASPEDGGTDEENQ